MSHPPFDKSSLLAALPRIRHGFFGRRSSSPAEGDDLNVSEAQGRNPADVAQNRRAAMAAADMATFVLASAAQVHSNLVLTLLEPPAPDARPQVDGFATNLGNIALAVITADCSPVLFADPKAGVIGACHAGWQGAVDGVLDNTLAAMVALGAKPENVTCAIGPTISGANYEVGPDFAESAIARNPAAEQFLFVPEGKTRTHFDLPGFIAANLTRLGIGAFDIAGGCTYASASKYFSHRHFTHHGGTQGRQISLIGQI